MEYSIEALGLGFFKELLFLGVIYVAARHEIRKQSRKSQENFDKTRSELVKMTNALTAFGKSILDLETRHDQRIARLEVGHEERISKLEVHMEHLIHSPKEG